MDMAHTCPTVPSMSVYCTVDPFHKYAYENEKVAFRAAMLAFEEKLAEYQVQMPPGFTELIDKHFWELIK